MKKELINGIELMLAKSVWAYNNEECRGTGVQTTTDGSGNYPRITGVLQYRLNRRGNPDRTRALVRISDVRHGTLYAWIDADHAVKVQP